MVKNDKGIIVVFDGPSGVGKDTIISKLIQGYPKLFIKAASTTTRPMREGESQGYPYYFVSDEVFLSKIKSGEIFEHTTRHGTYRGMSKKIFDAIIKDGKIPLKDCDYIGLNALRETYPGKVVGIFLTAPKEMIIERLLARDKNDVTLNARIADYDSFVKTGVYFDYVIQNIEVEKTVKEVIEKIEEFFKIRIANK